MSNYPTNLTDKQWQVIKNIVETKERKKTKASSTRDDKCNDVHYKDGVSVANVSRSVRTSHHVDSSEYGINGGKKVKGRKDKASREVDDIAIGRYEKAQSEAEIFDEAVMLRSKKCRTFAKYF